MTDVFAAFPKHPVAIRPPGVGKRGWIGMVFASLIVGGLAVASAVWLAPPLLTDWQIHAAAEPVPGGHISGGHCTGKLFFEICDVTLSAPGAAAPRAISFAFADLHVGDYTVAVMADPAHPDLLTTDLALDNLWNRTAVLLGFWAVVVLVLVGATVAVVRRRRALAALGGSGRTLVPVAATLKIARPSRRVAQWTVTGEGLRKMNWTFPAKTRPFMLADGRVLAVTAPGADVAFPLDTELQWIDLTPAERAALSPVRAAA
jgi:hypothetical protein